MVETAGASLEADFTRLYRLHSSANITPSPQTTKSLHKSTENLQMLLLTLGCAKLEVVHQLQRPTDQSETLEHARRSCQLLGLEQAESRVLEKYSQIMAMQLNSQLDGTIAHQITEIVAEKARKWGTPAVSNKPAEVKLGIEEFEGLKIEADPIFIQEPPSIRPFIRGLPLFREDEYATPAYTPQYNDRQGEYAGSTSGRDSSSFGSHHQSRGPQQPQRIPDRLTSPPPGAYSHKPYSQREGSRVERSYPNQMGSVPPRRMAVETEPSDIRESTFGRNRKRQAEPASDDEGAGASGNGFVSGYQKLVQDSQKKNGRSGAAQAANSITANKKRSLGTTMKRGIGKFVPPLMSSKDQRDEEDSYGTMRGQQRNAKPMAVRPGPVSRSGSGSGSGPGSALVDQEEELIDERLRNIEPRMIEMIMNEIMDQTPGIDWDDIAGLEHAKNTIKEIVVWPMLRPDIFTGLRGPPKGLLLFGPPGTGKTLIGKCIASQSGATFFSISSSSLTSKWIGEGEKMVRALFAVARVHQPSVIFVDEIDSLLTQRTDGEVEATRRIKTEFLIQFDGCGTSAEDRILMIGATNRPQEIDEAARRRFRKKLYIPLPEADARRCIVENLLKKQTHQLSEEEICTIVTKTDGYSGSDMDGLVREAALGPIRDIKDIRNINASDVRPIMYCDFVEALTQVRASVSDKDLDLYIKFDGEYGSVNRK